jgi:DNA polymerase-1
MTDLHKLFMEMAEEHEDIHSIDDRVLIVDALNSYIRCFAAVPTMNDEGDHVGGMSGFLKSIGLAIRTFKPSRCVIVFDGRGGAQRRRKLYPDYKENRKSMTRLNRTYEFKDKDEEDQAMNFQLISLAHILRQLPVTVLAPPKVEADDVIAYIAQLIEEREGDAIIMSTDKDFLQVVSDKVHVWNPIKKRMYDVEVVLNEYFIHPNNFAIFRAIDGDKSDNIPGVKGIGPKSLVKYYPQLKEPEKQTVDSLIEFATQQQKGKIFEHIRNNREIITRNYALMRLDTANMAGETRMDLIRRLDDHESVVLNKPELTGLIREHQMLAAFGNYDQWVVTTFAPLTRFTLRG